MIGTVGLLRDPNECPPLNLVKHRFTGSVRFVGSLIRDLG